VLQQNVVENRGGVVDNHATSNPATFNEKAEETELKLRL